MEYMALLQKEFINGFPSDFFEEISETIFKGFSKVIFEEALRYPW